MPDICTKALTVKTVSSLEKILPTPNTDAPSFADGSVPYRRKIFVPNRIHRRFGFSLRGAYENKYKL